MVENVEILEGYVIEFKQVILMFYFDVTTKYHHFYLRPKLRNWFWFMVDNGCFQKLVPHFG